MSTSVSRHLTVTVAVRLTAAEAAELRRAAKAAGYRSLSAYLRHTLTKGTP